MSLRCGCLVAYRVGDWSASVRSWEPERLPSQALHCVIARDGGEVDGGVWSPWCAVACGTPQPWRRHKQRDTFIARITNEQIELNDMGLTSEEQDEFMELSQLQARISASGLSGGSSPRLQEYAISTFAADK